MSDTRAFFPLYGNYLEDQGVQGTLYPSITVAASTTAAPTTVFPGSKPSTSLQIEICNTTASWAFVNVGVLMGSQTVPPATITHYPIAPMSDKVMTVDPEVNAASVILASGTGNVIFTRGMGV